MKDKLVKRWDIGPTRDLRKSDQYYLKWDYIKRKRAKNVSREKPRIHFVLNIKIVVFIKTKSKKSFVQISVILLVSWEKLALFPH